METNSDKYLKYIDTLNSIGIALSAEKDRDQLLEKILSSAMDLTHADAGTLYLLNKDQHLVFEIIANRTLGIKLSKVTEKEIPIKPIPLYDAKGQPNLKNIVSFCVLQNNTINIVDAYHTERFDFSGMRKADKKLGYHSKSFLTIPLRNHENKIIGALQLINSVDEQTREVVSFSVESEHLAESLASQAAITLTQQELIQAQKDLFESFIKLIAKAIDEKSVYTSNHCIRVPIITLMLAEAAQNETTGSFKNFHLTQEQMEELRIAAWLHDCGKITTPEYVMNKATKLEALLDRMEIVNLRFEVLKRDIKIALLEKSSAFDKNAIEKEYKKSRKMLDQAKNYLTNFNQGGEFLSQKDKEKIKSLGEQYSYVDSEGNRKQLLSEEEIKNLSVSRGTLNDDEREIIQNHVRVTLEMLESLPYPEYLKNVPQIAGSHHERMDGKGYPRGLKADQLTIQARMVAIADIFEALTAADRPYKSAKTLKETMDIMSGMKKENHIDADLFDLFVKKKIYLNFAKRYLKPEQIDFE